MSQTDLIGWFADINSFFATRPDLAEVFEDPRRVFNYDETAMELGVSTQKVLAPVSKKQVYTVSSSTRDHVTLGVTVNAAGNMVPPRAVFAGKHNLATTKVNLPENGRSGVWQFSYTVNGWVDRKSMVAFIQDIGDFLAREDIPRPVLLFMDGAKCHLSLEIAQLCTKLNVQPILLCPNMTHLTQPWDLTYFQSFKA